MSAVRLADHALLEGDADGLGPVVRPKLGDDVTNVDLYGPVDIDRRSPISALRSPS